MKLKYLKVTVGDIGIKYVHSISCTFKHHPINRNLTWLLVLHSLLLKFSSMPGTRWMCLSRGWQLVCPRCLFLSTASTQHWAFRNKMSNKHWWQLRRYTVRPRSESSPDRVSSGVWAFFGCGPFLGVCFFLYHAYQVLKIVFEEWGNKIFLRLPKLWSMGPLGPIDHKLGNLRKILFPHSSKTIFKT